IDNTSDAKLQKYSNDRLQRSSTNKLSPFLKVIIHVEGTAPVYYPGEVYDSVYSLCYSFYSAFLTEEDDGVDLNIEIDIYTNRGAIPWEPSSKQYLTLWSEE